MMDREVMALNDISKTLRETNKLLKAMAVSLDRLEKKTLMSWTCSDEAGEAMVVEYHGGDDELTGSTDGA